MTNNDLVDLVVYAAEHGLRPITVTCQGDERTLTIAERPPVPISMDQACLLWDILPCLPACAAKEPAADA